MYNPFKKKKSVFGTKIFQERSWLDRQVDDAVYNRYIEQGCVLGEIKEQIELKKETSDK